MRELVLLGLRASARATTSERRSHQRSRRIVEFGYCLLCEFILQEAVGHRRRDSYGARAEERKFLHYVKAADAGGKYSSARSFKHCLHLLYLA